MRIHPSSLTFSPIGLNQKVGKYNSAQNKDENELSAAKDEQNKKSNPTSSPEEITKALNNISLGIDLSNQDNIIKPTNQRTNFKSTFCLHPASQCTTARENRSINNRNRYLRLITLLSTTHETAKRVFPYTFIFYRV